MVATLLCGFLLADYATGSWELVDAVVVARQCGDDRYHTAACGAWHRVLARDGEGRVHARLVGSGTYGSTVVGDCTRVVAVSGGITNGKLRY